MDGWPRRCGRRTMDHPMGRRRRRTVNHPMRGSTMMVDRVRVSRPTVAVVTTAVSSVPAVIASSVIVVMIHINAVSVIARRDEVSGPVDVVTGHAVIVVNDITLVVHWCVVPRSDHLHRSRLRYGSGIGHGPRGNVNHTTAARQRAGPEKHHHEEGPSRRNTHVGTVLSRAPGSISAIPGELANRVYAQKRAFSLLLLDSTRKPAGLFGETILLCYPVKRCV